MLIPLRDDRHLQARPIVTYTIIGVCILLFSLQQSLEEVESQRLIFSFGIIPALLFEHARLAPGLKFVSPEATLFTSMFLHAGWIHLIGNMLYLWIFGDDVEDSMGRGRYLVFYLLCGLVGALSHVVAYPTSGIPVVGASGAVSGVLGAYILLYPHSRILVLLPMGPFSRLVRLPAFLVLGFWIVFQLLNTALAGVQEGGVAWYAHIGGFVTGLALVPLFKHRTVSLLQPAHGSRRWLRKL
ncbi:MAG: rhomboid family intramembrane serine protease [Gammaproteobacteria bacterium]